MKIHQIPRNIYSKPLVDSIMNLVVSKSVLVLDLRNNTGGADGFTQYLSSYFLPKNTLLFTRVSNNGTQEFFTENVPSKKKHKEMPIYILVNRQTESAAEQLSYLLQNHDRVTIIGEKTFGAVHGSIDVQLNYGMVGFVPVGFEKHIKTGRDWEGTGVIPDVLTASDNALKKAILLSNSK